MGLVPKDPLISDVDSANDDCVNSILRVCNPTYKRVTEKTYRINFYLEEDVGNLVSGQQCASETGIVSNKC